MKDELDEQIMKYLVRLRAKSYLNGDNDQDQKAKGTKKVFIKRKLQFQDYKNCFEAAQIENKTNYLDKTKIEKNL